MLDRLDPQPSDRVLDLTVGAAGHLSALAARAGEDGVWVGVDQDPEILERASANLPAGATLTHGNFSDCARLRDQWPVDRFDVVLADLGVSSLQLDRAERGFSFRREAPLDMRMDPTRGVDAAAWIRSVTVEELIQVISEYGEERYSKRIAAAIFRARDRIETTTELAQIIVDAVPAAAARERIHPATRTFQAIRIAVNRELESLERLLQAFPTLMAPGGRFGVISFHSLEDRRVKQAFQVRVKEGGYESLTPKPVRATSAEIASNPRSRSARLRVVRKKDY